MLNVDLHSLAHVQDEQDLFSLLQNMKPKGDQKGGEVLHLDLAELFFQSLLCLLEHLCLLLHAFHFLPSAACARQRTLQQWKSSLYAD